MELVYSVTQSDRSSTHIPVCSSSSTTTSAWSRNNLLAYSQEKVAWGYVEHDVRIMDPNQPWNVHVIPIKTAPVKQLKWNPSGKKLLCVTMSGACTVWATSKNLTNSWKEKANFASDLCGEEILVASWLSDGRKPFLNLDRTKEPKEKVTKTYSRPILSQIGGQPMEGYLVVTASGLVAVKCVTQSDQPIIAKTQLKTTNLVRIADIAYTNQGNVVIMTTSGFTENPVDFWTIKLTYNDETSRLSFDVDKMPSISLRCATEGAGTYPSISHACFMSPFNSEHVLICAANSTASIIEAWLFKDCKEPLPSLHPAFIPQTGLLGKLVRWKLVPGLSTPFPQILSISLPQVLARMSAIKASQDMKLLNILGIALLLPNNTIKILNKISLQELLTFQIPDDVTKDSVSNVTIGQKRSRNNDVSFIIGHIQFSPMSCALAVFDRHSNLTMYKVAPWLHSSPTPDLNMAVKHLMHLLYYCMFVGQDWWDVVLHVQGGIATSVCDALTQEFASQPRALQQMLRSRLLAVKISIYQRTARNADAIDCHLRLMFEAIAVVFRSLLRLPQNSQEDQEPADKLHEACSAPFETDISKLLQSFETDQRTLQSLQQLIQWVADVTLYLLAIVPQASSGLPNLPGSSLAFDKEFLATLREVLVILQMWRLLKSACAPVFCILDDRIDGLPLAFKLLTDVLSALSAVDFQGHIPDSVIDKCCLLTSQIVVPTLDVIRPVNGVLQRLSSDSQSFRFQFDMRPCNPQLSSFAPSARFLRVDDVAKVDNLRRIYLGTFPAAPLKTCSRCGVVSMLNSKQDSVIECWDQRFAVTCLCGGSWQAIDLVPKK